MSIKNNYRYPGSRPFNDSDLDRQVFFGREREKQALLHKVLAKNLVVLYAKSGLGKTSLINAGLCQLLREKGYLPLKTRFNIEKIDPLHGLYEGIRKTIHQYSIDYDPGEEETLWQYFKTVSFWSHEDTLLCPVLVLDQFEDFFIFHAKEARKEFIEQLANLVRNTIPEKIRKSLVAGNTLPYSEKPPNIKILISIREDFLGQLYDLSSEIPTILHNLFRLKALTREQAREAIIKPSQLYDDKIKTPCFFYDPVAIESIIDFLSKKKEKDEIITSNEVESFQLQILCRHLEVRISERIKKNKVDNIIREDDLCGESGMQKVLQNYYEDQLDKLGSEQEKGRVRELFEKYLISKENRRLSQEEGEIKRRYKVKNDTLSKLVDYRLLRAESRLGSIYYELTHDSLIEPIRESQKLRAKSMTGVTVLCTFINLCMKIMYEELGKRFEEETGIITINNFVADGPLIDQFQVSPMGDIVNVGAEVFMDKIKDHVEYIKPVTIRNPVIVVPFGNPARIKTLYDFAKSNVKVIVCDNQTSSMGWATKNMFDKLGITKKVEPNILYYLKSSFSLIPYIKLHQADAGVCWRSVALQWVLKNKAEKEVEIIDIPLEQQVNMTTMIAIVKNSKHKKFAKKFIDWVTSEKLADLYKEFGYTKFLGIR